MTEWIPVNMHPLEGMPGLFEFHCKLAKGFKYRFQFLYRGNIVLDENFDVSIDNEGNPTN